MRSRDLIPVWGEGSLSQLFLDDAPLINPWGMETADARSFFSLETGGWGNQVLSRGVQHNARSQRATLTVRMAEGLWQTTLYDAVDGSMIVRQMDYRALEDTWAMDLVMRFVFRHHAIKKAMIAGMDIPWDGSNYYHQHATNTVVLDTGSQCLRIVLQECQHPDGWQPYMYVRCCPGEDAWVVHIRLLPSSWTREIIKFRYTVFPKRLASFLLRSWRLAGHLRYAGERRRWLGSRLRSYPMGIFCAGTGVSVAARVELQ